jgi:hypothetical protein
MISGADPVCRRYGPNQRMYVDYPHLFAEVAPKSCIDAYPQGG